METDLDSAFAHIFGYRILEQLVLTRSNKNSEDVLKLLASYVLVNEQPKLLPFHAWEGLPTDFSKTNQE